MDNEREIEAGGLILGELEGQTITVYPGPHNSIAYINKDDAKAIIQHLTEQFKLDVYDTWGDQLLPKCEINGKAVGNRDDGMVRCTCPPCHKASWVKYTPITA